MIPRIARSSEERVVSATQHQAVANPILVVLEKDIKNAILLQTAKQIKIKMKKAKELGEAV